MNTNTEIEIVNNNKELIQKLVLDGDLSKMNGEQKVAYYNQFCQTLGLNPLTQPFQLIKFREGQLRMYATKDCTEQLRKIHGVSITDISTTSLNGVFIVTAKALDKNGKTDAATGVVSIEGLKGDNLANAIMKAETKAKRRVTLSICGLGILDESETDTLKDAVTEDIKPESVTTVTPPAPVKPEVRGNFGKPPKNEGLDQIAIEHWQQSLKECENLEDMTRLYNSNKSTVNNEPVIFEMFKHRKKQLA